MSTNTVVGGLTAPSPTDQKQMLPPMRWQGTLNRELMIIWHLSDVKTQPVNKRRWINTLRTNRMNRVKCDQMEVCTCFLRHRKRRFLSLFGLYKLLASFHQSCLCVLSSLSPVLCQHHDDRGLVRGCDGPRAPVPPPRPTRREDA